MNMEDRDEEEEGEEEEDEEHKGRTNSSVPTGPYEACLWYTTPSNLQ